MWYIERETDYKVGLNNRLLNLVKCFCSDWIIKGMFVKLNFNNEDRIIFWWNNCNNPHNTNLKKLDSTSSFVSFVLHRSRVQELKIGYKKKLG